MAALTKDQYDVYIVDTETDNLNAWNGSIVEIAIVQLSKNTLHLEKLNCVYQSLVKPKKLHRDAWIFDNSDITVEDIAQAPSEQQVAQDVQLILKNKAVTTFNASFDFGFLNKEPYKLKTYIATRLPCIMYADDEVCQIPHEYYDTKWPSLEEAWEILVKEVLPPDAGSHRAAVDAFMAAKVLQHLIHTDQYDFEGE